MGKVGSLGHGRLSAGRPDRNRISGIRARQSMLQRRNPLCGRLSSRETESTSPCFSAISRDFRRN
ncbi:hypothetical protein FM111_05210 [Brevundimonas diminuta 3F5N]|uniref:Uncharacterized protein n=1 Tax=Brevundimonas diminuta 3F5N TaxID=1255603 RepID=A0A1R4FJG2_BREDI|nr:hypothetical protein FM111_05210 [Brevundimonas diminuta 3F5N]